MLNLRVSVGNEKCFLPRADVAFRLFPEQQIIVHRAAVQKLLTMLFVPYPFVKPRAEGDSLLRPEQLDFIAVAVLFELLVCRTGALIPKLAVVGTLLGKRRIRALVGLGEE